MTAILDSLGLGDKNPGTWYGGDSSVDDTAGLIESVNPSSGEVIASVHSTSREEYDRLIDMARDSFRTWRMVPAPVRGNAVRGNAFGFLFDASHVGYTHNNFDANPGPSSGGVQIGPNVCGGDLVCP